MSLRNKSILIFIISILLLLPLAFSSAQGLVPCGNGREASNACTLCHFIVGINGVIDYGLKLLITVAAVAIFISGVMYIVSGGNEGMTTTAKNFLSASLTGFTIVISAWFIVNVVLMWILSFNIETIQKVNWYTFECSTVSSSSNQPASGEEPPKEAPKPKTSCICAKYQGMSYFIDGEITEVTSKEECKSICKERGSPDYYRLGGETTYSQVNDI